jgi:hypothetical protein
MFGGIAGAGGDRILFAQHDGDVFTLDVEERAIVGWMTPHPFSPEKLEISACAVGPDETVLLTDVLHRRVRQLDPSGRPVRLFGRQPVPGLRHPDEPGVFDEPAALHVSADELVVVSAGEDQEYGVQRFGWDGEVRGPFEHPTGGFFRAHGIARIGDELWVTETEGGTIRRFSDEGAFLGDVKLHYEMQRPFRLASDGYGGVLLLLAPETEAEQDVSGVARLAEDGSFEGWVVAGGEEPGEVHLPFDLAVLSDGRFVVADLPAGGPPDVRLQLFGADGRFVRTLVADRVELAALKEEWVHDALGRQAGNCDELTMQARIEHYLRAAEEDAVERAALLYRAATAMDASDPRPRAGLGALFQHIAALPREAAVEYDAAIQAGAPEAEFRARIAECRHALGDIAGAIELLKSVMDGPEQPEESGRLLDQLGSWYLELAGEDPEG